MLRQFVTETAKNFAELGARRALTGPAVRGDWATIRRHLTALRRPAPDFVPVYQSLLTAMLTLAGAGNTALGSSKSKSKGKVQKSKGQYAIKRREWTTSSMANPRTLMRLVASAPDGTAMRSPRQGTHSH